ncbi:unnamed protein product [Schistosoma turkestanicum]|nr:unnamed protein product [Schistosoma turkestanicum]
MILLQSMPRLHSRWFGFYIMKINLLSTLFMSTAMMMTMINVQSDSAVTTGSCFAKRLNSGNCIGLMKDSITQLECCKRRGFYLNRQITQQEYLTDHLLFESGTPNCVQACDEELPSSCKGYVCPEGHYCRMINNEPKCKCRLRCTAADYLTGPLCTTNLRRFHNQCHLKQARCALPKESLEVIPCPDEGLRCSELSILSERNLNLNSMLKQLYSGGNENDDVDVGDVGDVGDDVEEQSKHTPSLFSTLTSTSPTNKPIQSSSTNNQEYIDNDNENIIIMNRKLPTDSNAYLLSSMNKFNNNDESIFDEKSLYSNVELSKELICNANEYCLLRQFDGRPSCEYWSEESWQTLTTCPESTFHQPMCSIDNQTFYNSCDLKLAGLKNQLETRIAYKGECRSKATCSNIECPRAGMRCTPHHLTGQPVCMDCAKLPLDCNASFRNGQETLTPSASSSLSLSPSTGITATSTATTKRRTQVFGDPVWKTPVQTYGWPIVCGSNGKTYRNTCFLHVVNCLSDKFVELKKPEFCSGKFS